LETSKKTGIPRFIFIIIPLILAAMYYYAVFIESNPAEKTVEDFYQAYLSQDYDTVAEKLSVFWSLQLLPQYSSMSPQELIDNREQIEKDTSAVIAEIEGQNGELASEENIEVVPLPEYTIIVENSALVVYSILENGQQSGMEMAILIMEKGQLRIYSISPVNEQILQTISKEDLLKFDENLKELLG